LFVKTNSVELSTASFLDQRFMPSNSETCVIKISEMLPLLPVELPSTPKYIFHTAFCCSTLLARCLDFPEQTVSLKEPQVLMTLANYKRTQHAGLRDSAKAESLYRLISWLLFRPLVSAKNHAQKIIIKPTNTVNNIINKLLSVHPESRAILLHSDLESFLISLLKKGEEGRAFGRNLFNIFQMDSAEAQQMSHLQLMRMTDLQIGALAWHLQLEHFLAALNSESGARVKSLHCDRLLADSEMILEQAIRHLVPEELGGDIAAVVAAAPLANNAKTPGESFTARDRQDEHLDTRKQYSASLDIITPWAKQLHFKYPFTEKLSHPL
jgi:hypothetical protein